MKIKPVVKGMLYTLSVIVVFVVVYFISAFILSRISVSAKDNEPKQVDIYILSNGVHTDIVVPVKSEYMDWNTMVDYKHTIAAVDDMKYLAFGWGDKGFYLETPTWADLKFSVAFKAMFHLGSSAMHTTFYHEMSEGSYCKKISISAGAYKKLVNYIIGSFELSEEGNSQVISGHHYDNYDSFYEANRTYNLFFTCNTWANNALKSANQKAALWTPFDTGIFYHY